MTDNSLNYITRMYMYVCLKLFCGPVLTGFILFCAIIVNFSYRTVLEGKSVPEPLIQDC